MKLSLVFNPFDCKLDDVSYSQTYRDQWLALGRRFKEIQPVTEDCSVQDIDGDVIIFYDPHSSHHIKIDGIEKHKAIKYEYMDDPDQLSAIGVHRKTGVTCIKLGAKERTQRAMERAIDYIICPYTENYYKYLSKFLKDAEKMLVWFPPCTDIERYEPITKLSERKQGVLANGSVYHREKFNGYQFRKWAFKQDNVEFIMHCMGNNSTPRGVEYPKLLLKYAGALALCDTHIPPKYIEIPMAGCVCFAQYQNDYERMGFKDRENCIYVNKYSFHDLIEEFKADVGAYQHIADAGRKLVEEKWTSEKFADFIYNHAKEHVNGGG